MQGKIIKGIAGFYYVHVPSRGTFECKAKGILRNRRLTPLVGDDVELEVVDGEKFLGSIINILPRSSALIRPAVANVDQSLLVFAMSEPIPNLGLLDSFLVMMEYCGLSTIICFNKADEAAKEEGRRLSEIYAGSRCPVVVTSTRTNEGMEELRRLLLGKTTALAGPSGVGKSSILNALLPDISMETGSISEKIGRGRHTTRHSEFFVMEEGSYILDTPGFTSLSPMVKEKEKLRFYIPEFEAYEGKCRFNGCVHINEPDCAVKTAVREGRINKLRYEHYTKMYEQIAERKTRMKYKA